MTMGEGRLEEGRPIEPALPLAAARAIKIDGDAVTHLGRRYRIWLSPPIEGKINTGCFAADAPGRWYFRLQSEVEEHTNCGSGEVGIDLGLKSLAALSTGEKIPNPRHYRKYERALGKAQQARNTKRVRAIHVKIAMSDDAICTSNRRGSCESARGRTLPSC